MGGSTLFFSLSSFLSQFFPFSPVVCLSAPPAIGRGFPRNSGRGGDPWFGPGEEWRVAISKSANGRPGAARGTGRDANKAPAMFLPPLYTWVYVQIEAASSLWANQQPTPPSSDGLGMKNHARVWTLHELFCIHRQHPGAHPMEAVHLAVGFCWGCRKQHRVGFYRLKIRCVNARYAYGSNRYNPTSYLLKKYM